MPLNLHAGPLAKDTSSAPNFSQDQSGGDCRLTNIPTQCPWLTNGIALFIFYVYMMDTTQTILLESFSNYASLPCTQASS